MLKSALSSRVKTLISRSKIPEEMKSTYLDVLEYLPQERIEKMIYLLQKEQLILQK